MKCIFTIKNSDIFWKFNQSCIISEKEQHKVSPQVSPQINKQVSFATIAEVILIPTREEYDTFRHKLWYNSRDYQMFITNFHR